MNTLWCDIETFSHADLKRTGSYRYAQDPSTEVTLFAWALNDTPARVEDFTAGAMSDTLRAHLLNPNVILISHNSMFDRVVIKYTLGIGTGITRWRDTMIWSLSHALPGKLSEVGAALGLPEDQQKLKAESKLVQKFCKPAPANRKVSRYTRENSPAEWADFIRYAKQDVETMRHVASHLPDWNTGPIDLATWHVDQRINDRGFLVDVALTKAGAAAKSSEAIALDARLSALTEGACTTGTNRNQIMAFLASEGIDLPDLTKDTVEQTLKRRDLSRVAREVLTLRQSAGKTSTSKYAALDAAVGFDGRFRGGLQFAGAGRTRRFAGRIFQPQNLPSRGLPKAGLVAQYIDALKYGTHDLLFGDDTAFLAAAALRGAIIAPPGKKLVVADLSNIEGRMLSWVAGEDWKLDAFREYDEGTGPDLYNVTASSIIGGSPWDVKKGDRNVFGKVPDLASGYRGGVSGYQTFARAYSVRMADHWETIQANIAAEHVERAQWAAAQPWAVKQINELEISEAEWIASETCKLAWRARHPATVALWAHLQEACHNAVQNPNTSFKAGRWLSARCVTHKGHEWLLVKLPSGRYLTYFEPKLVQGDYGLALTYMADASEAGSTSRQWRRTFTHGGKLTGNVCQTLARDLLVDSITRAEEAGYEVVLSVHDELIAEVPDSPSFSADGLGAIMATVPAWAPGLPLAAAGFETDRYRKE